MYIYIYVYIYVYICIYIYTYIYRCIISIPKARNLADSIHKLTGNHLPSDGVFSLLSGVRPQLEGLSYMSTI